MTTVERSIDVDVPVGTAYEHWTDFESFPRFMESVEEVRSLDDRRLYWKVEIGGVEREFDSEIVEQIPGHRIAWSSVTGPRQGGVVTFHELDDETTRVMYQMDFEPEGMAETVGAVTGVVSRSVEQDLENLKEYVEADEG